MMKRPSIRSQGESKRPSWRTAVYLLIGAGFASLFLSNPLVRSGVERALIVDAVDDIDDNHNAFNKEEQQHEWWGAYVDEASRAYPPWGGRTWQQLQTKSQSVSDPEMFSWCKSQHSVKRSESAPASRSLGENRTASHQLEGLIYIKSHKASSSTCSGIARSIAHHVAKRALKETDACAHKAHHRTGDRNLHANRHPTKSLMWTFVREPSARDLSHVYYFRISHRNASQTDENVISMLQNQRGRQTRYLAPHAERNDGEWPGYIPSQRPQEFTKLLREEIFDNYEFIGITERMETSLAVMTLLFHLPPDDVIVLSARQSGGYDAGEFGGVCYKIQKAKRTSAVQEYLSNAHRVDNMDTFLYAVANRSLDKTIEKIGKERVQARADEIRNLQQIANQYCQTEAVFPCSSDGVYQLKASKQSCYVRDTGCGHACVDRVLRQYRQGKLG